MESPKFQSRGVLSPKMLPNGWPRNEWTLYSHWIPFPFLSTWKAVSNFSYSLQTAMISRLPEHNSHDPFRIPLSSYYLIPLGVILQLYDILGQLPLQSLLLAVIIFNLLETTHFSTGWQKSKQGRRGGRKKKEETGLWIHSAGKIKMLVLKICLALLFLFW